MERLNEICSIRRKERGGGSAGFGDLKRIFFGGSWWDRMGYVVGFVGQIGWFLVTIVY